MKRLVLASSILAVLAAAQQAGAPQQKGGSVGSAPKKSTPSKTAPRPSPAIGNDIVQLIDSLVAAGAEKGKGEYETTEEYESRSNAICARYGRLMFLVPEKAATFEYDADKREVNAHLCIWLRLLDGAPDSDGPPEALILKSERVGSSSYIGTNAFGAKTAIQLRTEFEHGIIISRSSKIVKTLAKDDTGYEYGFATYGFTFPLDIAQARTIKPFLRALAVGKPDEARVYKGHDHIAATLDSPSEVRRKGVFLRFLIDEVRILDIRSGKLIRTPSQEGETIP
jgi:hypothetical protein